MICGSSSLITTFSSNCANLFFAFLLLKVLFLIPGETGGYPRWQQACQGQRWCISWDVCTGFQKAGQEPVVMRVPQSQETAGGKYWHPNTSFQQGSCNLGHSKYPIFFCQWGKRNNFNLCEWMWCEEQGFTLNEEIWALLKRGVCRKDRLHVNHEGDAVGTWNANDAECLTWRMMSV